MERVMKEKSVAGIKNNNIQPYERRHAEISRRAATEGMVLLKNDNNILPLEPDSSVALFGSGVSKTLKGGTGSGDVNERHVVTIYEGMINAGYKVTTEEWIKNYNNTYEKARNEWKEHVLEKAAQIKDNPMGGFAGAYLETPFLMPPCSGAVDTDTDTAIFVISRVAGEGADRKAEKGDYYLWDEEDIMLQDICRFYSKVIVVINAGGIIDLSFLQKHENIYSVIYMMQPGMEAGNALADIISGKVTPSGKLTDTWAVKYEDYPNAKIYSHNNGDVINEKYEEGIFVGYRYFDTFDVPTQYGFGYGLSYTNFSLETNKVSIVKGTDISVAVNVKNTGEKYSGKEVVQAYVSLPVGRLEKEYRRLAGFAKTKNLKPGDRETLNIQFSINSLESYDEENSQWMLERGSYGIWVGNSLESSELVAAIDIEEDIILKKVESKCTLKEELHQLHSDKEKAEEKCYEVMRRVNQYRLPNIKPGKNVFSTHSVETVRSDIGITEEAEQLAETLTQEQLISLVVGETGNGTSETAVARSVSVSGAAGETSSCAKDKGIATIVMADGPAGLRINQTYYVENGAIVSLPFAATLDGGIFYEGYKGSGEEYHQYCTAFPIGTLLAQTWNTELVKEVGKAVGFELKMYHVTLWLAPGMNIHRNPLCGRNFEYYSEDPYVTGMIASAMTEGVQSVEGCGTTLKHFACNNEEDNRKGSNSILTERTLREIYLKGFEIAVKKAQPRAVMTSYNLINGIHSANNYELCTSILRQDWGFQGMVMTDWTTTMGDPTCTASGCIKAGNDLIMPGSQADKDNIKESLSEGKVTIEELKCCAARIIKTILASNEYE